MKYACPCCGYFTYDHRPNGDFDICPVCFWEDDAVQSADPSFAGGANKVSLAEARENFLSFGACDEASKEHVRAPFEDEKRALTMDDLYRMERHLWDAIQSEDAQAFLNQVSEDVMMVHAGCSYTAREYANEISKMNCGEYELKDFEIVSQDTQSVQVRYCLRMLDNLPENEKLKRLYYVTTTRRNMGQAWDVVFYMDTEKYSLRLERY